MAASRCLLAERRVNVELCVRVSLGLASLGDSPTPPLLCADPRDALRARDIRTIRPACRCLTPPSGVDGKTGAPIMRATRRVEESRAAFG